MLAPNLIIIWPGTHVTIPSGYSRETTLDGLYPKGAAAAANPNTTGGAATHTHSSPSHTHTINSHVHTGVLSTTNHVHPDSAKSDDDGSDGNAINAGDHHHVFTASTLTSGSVSSETVTYAAYSNDPPHQKVIFIRSNGYQGLPDDSVILFAADTVPDGFTICDGGSSTPNLVNKYLKGAGSGADSDIVSALGSLTNTHTIAHTHSTSHGHSATSGNASSSGDDRLSGANVPNSMSWIHTHAVTLNAAALTSSQPSSIGAQAETVEPAYTKLLPIQNTSGNKKLCQKNMVAMYLGTLAQIPAGWKLCDGANGTVDMQARHLKMASAVGEIDDTGGANSHTHAAESHSHTIATHNHTGSAANAAETVGRKASGDQKQAWGGSGANEQPNHTIASVDANDTTMTSADTTANSSANEPEFRTVLFLEFDFMLGGGGLLGLL